MESHRAFVRVSGQDLSPIPPNLRLRSGAIEGFGTLTILTTEKLELDHFLALLDRYASVVRIRDWVARPDCERLAATMMRASGIRTQHQGMDIDGSKWATDHDRVGPSFTGLYRDWLAAGERGQDILDAYVLAAEKARTTFSQAVRSSPIERLFHLADLCWPNGAVPAALSGTPVFFGSGRIWGGRPALQDPHVDSIHPSLYRFDGQLSAVAYLRVPDSGGELEYWDVDEEAYTQGIIDKTVSRADLPEPLRIKPRKGELILFNARKPHHVSQVSEGWRVVQQCFIGLGRAQPLTFWT